MLANMSNIDKNINISMQVGVGNNQRFININHLYETLGSDVSAALPTFHAITGCDFNPAFFRKGKKRPYLMMTKNKEFVYSFIAMSTSPESREDLFDKIQEFVCRLYGFKKINDIKEARVAAFMRNYKVLENDNVFRLPNKTIDGSALPPCKVELQQQFLRACYIAQIWAHAHLQVPSGETPLDYGWEEMENRYQFKWFPDSQLPTSLDEITIQPEKDDDKDILTENSESDSDSDSDDDATSSSADQSEEET